MFVLWMLGCTRDVVIGVENLPADESFVLLFDGERIDNRSANIWEVANVSMKVPHSMSLWYGERECTMTNPHLLNEYGLGELQHRSDWSCPGLMGYSMKEVNGLLVGESEVTVGLWQLFKGENREDKCGVDCPKSNLTWLAALEFANQLSIAEGLPQCYVKTENAKNEAMITSIEGCTGYRIPTDEEWVQLSSLDSTAPYADSTDAQKVGWVKDNSGIARHPVCQLERNGYGLCDVTGNVWEWCWDASLERPELRSVRGGGFTSANETALRSNRVDFPASLSAEHIGFRLLRSTE